MSITNNITATFQLPSSNASTFQLPPYNSASLQLPSYNTLSSHQIRTSSLPQSDHSYTFPILSNNGIQRKPATETYDTLYHYLYEKIHEIDITSDKSLDFLIESTEFSKTEENKNLINIVRLYNEVFKKIIMHVIVDLYNSQDRQVAHMNLGKWIKIMDDIRKRIEGFEFIINNKI